VGSTNRFFESCCVTGPKLSIAEQLYSDASYSKQVSLVSDFDGRWSCLGSPTGRRNVLRSGGAEGSSEEEGDGEKRKRLVHDSNRTGLTASTYASLLQIHLLTPAYHSPHHPSRKA